MLSFCPTPALGTPVCTSGAFFGVVRPAYAQVRRRPPVPARVTPRRSRAGVWSMDLALRIMTHYIMIARQSVFVALCGSYWSLLHGPEKHKAYQHLSCLFSVLVRVRETSFARMRARIYVRACVHA